MKISAAAFDLDGTLYPNAGFYWRLLPFLVRESRYLWAFGKARDRLRAGGDLPPGVSLYQKQAEYMAEILRIPAAGIEERTRRLIYRGWEPLFKNVPLFPHVRETLAALSGRGLTLALLSDFPPEAKLGHLGLSRFFTTVLCSEETGRLKPHPAPFQALAAALGLPPEEILYVGNSFAYDIAGAKNAGMKTAWKVPWYARYRKRAEADIVFSGYRSLLNSLN